MSTKKKRDLLEIFKAKASMSEQASSRDPELAFYAGAFLETGYQIAQCDLFLKYNLIQEPLRTLLKFRRAHLQQKRKAELMAGMSEVSTLGFMLGMKYDFIDAT